jgi:hypothetical protein
MAVDLPMYDVRLVYLCIKEERKMIMDALLTVIRKVFYDGTNALMEVIGRIVHSALSGVQQATVENKYNSEIDDSLRTLRLTKRLKWDEASRKYQTNELTENVNIPVISCTDGVRVQVHLSSSVDDIDELYLRVTRKSDMMLELEMFCGHDTAVTDIDTGFITSTIQTDCQILVSGNNALIDRESHVNAVRTCTVSFIVPDLHESKYVIIARRPS